MRTQLLVVAIVSVFVVFAIVRVVVAAACRERLLHFSRYPRKLFRTRYLFGCCCFSCCNSGSSPIFLFLQLNVSHKGAHGMHV